MSQANLGDVFEFTRGELNAIVNGLSEAPAKSTYALIKSLLERSPVRTESVEATPEDTGAVLVPEVVAESAQS